MRSSVACALMAFFLMFPTAVKTYGNRDWLFRSKEIIKVIPRYCIAHPYCARFRVISVHTLARARAKLKRFPSN